MAAGIPDNVRCGSVIYYITWTRLILLSVAAAVSVLLFSTFISLVPHVHGLAEDVPLLDEAALAGGDVLPPLSMGDTADGASARVRSARSIGDGTNTAQQHRPKRKSGGARKYKSGPLDRFCEVKGSLYFLDKWHLATLGANGYPTADRASAVCDWKEGTSTQVPFRMCTYDRAADTQVSAYIHKEGHWNGWKKEVFERMLPVLQPVGGTGPAAGAAAGAAPGSGAGGVGAGSAVDPFPERTLVIDVGANIGFYTLLFATRGYDVLAIEPSRESVARLLFSLEGNGVRAARSGSEVGLSAGKPLLRSGAGGGGSNGDGSASGPKSAAPAPQRSGRQPIVYVYQNAASDLYSSAYLQYIADNPGASSVVADAQPQAVTTIFLDDLLADGFRDPDNKGQRPHIDSAPALDPTRVRAIKISAEGMDARALHGMRRLLGLGEVPYLLMVYNRDHVKNAGCDPLAMIRGLFEHGYRLYHAGVYIYRDVELERFLTGMTSRSSELLFVQHNADY